MPRGQRQRVVIAATPIADFSLGATSPGGATEMPEGRAEGLLRKRLVDVTDM
ncbi:hypothetical protein HMPREF9597_00797 [Cutibacterium acnes HL005PA4]|uniref:hypothetical protein n=1 Tax=Cutibacterium acnes TaxID=1747 RepID=UPI000185C7E8|nr:hypothetical protein [Cutibacterium acnes]AEE71475.1 hypothetical protein PAZ_c02730 [Cutibacterium acnes 266]EFS36655.1 hypothetical protein HMPREF9567_00372 [Cutibacterium acnes HL013PA1]EFS38760.1 hypothetical protein HMPREF9574_00790 [Cutibacterium acnes HL074PA1]EFS41251.1 hypothetical protein HMPREF9575_01279 [Cutibacterium acnes HL110PA1]EFS43945.1 hypothetical protein HMPREF9576_00822 [Cutibacterium acnes HL110PA2]EFS44892.1 hypothetical protein HMPREF9580_02153 [Cutibacterium acne